MNIVERVKRLLLQPRREWAVIDAEPHTVQGLYTQYVMILAAIPPVATFLGFTLVAFGVMRLPFAAGVAHMVLSYVLTLAGVYVAALVIEGLAPHFGGEKRFIQAFKVVAFGGTAAWVAGIVLVIPLLGILALIGALYSLYLIFVGLPLLMKVPHDKAVPFFVVTLVVMIVIWVAIAFVASLAIPGQVRGF